MNNTLNRRNVGILAHVDAGKTTLTEQLLYKSGSIRVLGSVNKGTTQTDCLEIERQRGISVKSAETEMNWKNTFIHIIDTPGHVDFSAEVERSIRILDGAVVVISAVEGVQPQTEIYFKTLKAMNIPVLFFINKIDRTGSDIKRVIEEIKVRLTKDILEIQNVSGEGTTTLEVSSVINKPYIPEKYVEQLADFHQGIMEKYIEGDKITNHEFIDSLKDLSTNSKVYPILFGASLKGIGIEELLDAIFYYLPNPKGNTENPLSAVVYKIQQDKIMGKMAYVRLYDGHINNRDIVVNSTKNIEEKVTQIRKLSSGKEIDCGKIQNGEIGVIAGLSKISIGDILGDINKVPKVPTIATALLTLRVYPKLEKDFIKLVEAMYKLQEEDPILNVQWIKEKKEIHIHIMGMIQKEIIGSILLERFGIEVRFGKPSIIYKETPSSVGVGFEAYTMPKPCWAIVKFLIEPLKKGSGLIFESKIRTEQIKERYIREVEKQIPKALEQGIYGWQVIDLKVTLVAGEDHVMHSRSGDFIIATSMAIMNGLSNTSTTLLEPMLNFRIIAPEEVGGKIIGDLVIMRATFESPMILNGKFIVQGEIPAATSLEYPIRLGIISSGKGIIINSFSGYKPCPIELGATTERIGVDPLDRAKFILSARKAFE